MKNWSLGFRENLVTFPENLVTFHKLLQPTIAVRHDGSPLGGQTMECHKENDEPNNLQATMSPTLPYVEQLKTVKYHWQFDTAATWATN
jgi:hypothetical protein